ncbi:MAG: nitrogenase component 1 [Elusimicrobiota bacterium]
MTRQSDAKTSSGRGTPGKPPPMIRHVSAGPRALAAMGALLGFKPKSKGWRLEGLCCLEHKNICLRLREGEHRLVFYLLPRRAPESLLSTAGLSLSVEGRAGAGVMKFLEVAAARLGARRFESVARLIEEDPQSFTEDVAPGQDGDRIKVPCIGQPIGLLEAGWRNFYADQDFEVLLSVPSCSDPRTVNIEYTDLECYYARPRRNYKKWTFLDWPQESETRSGAVRGASSIVTELAERDMIMGTGEKADALVAEVRKRAAAGNYLLFTHLCTPIVMGEDFSGLARRCEAEVGGTSVRWSQKDRDENDNFGDHFRALMGRPGFFDEPADALAVNLFHFPASYRDSELRPFLRKIGLKTNVCVLPDVSLSALDDLPKAVWQIFCDRSSYPTKIREILTQTSRPVITVRAPYGVEGTRECLRGIAAAAGKETEFSSAWTSATASFLPAWEEMKLESSRYSLAFVVSESTLPRLMTLRYGQGAPLVKMSREMGFAIDILYYDLHGETARLPAGLEGARVTVFRTPWELERALRDGEFRAVYSDVVFDWRVMRAGKARFGGRDFEMGLEGAMRTFQKLLSICRLPFYRRYASHLSGPRGDRHVG